MASVSVRAVVRAVVVPVLLVRFRHVHVSEKHHRDSLKRIQIDVVAYGRSAIDIDFVVLNGPHSIDMDRGGAIAE